MAEFFGHLMMEVYNGRCLLDQAFQRILNPDVPAGLTMNPSEYVVMAGTPQVDEHAFKLDMFLASHEDIDCEECNL